MVIRRPRRELINGCRAGDWQMMVNELQLLRCRGVSSTSAGNWSACPWSAGLGRRAAGRTDARKTRLERKGAAHEARIGLVAGDGHVRPLGVGRRPECHPGAEWARLRRQVDLA